MRLRSVSNLAISAAATAGSLASASPAPNKHRHGHNIENRSPDNVKTVDVPGPTVITYQLNGKIIDPSEVCQGIQDGSLKWADGINTVSDCPSGMEPVSQPLQTSSISAAVSDTNPITQPSVDVQQKQTVPANPIQFSPTANVANSAPAGSATSANASPAESTPSQPGTSSSAPSGSSEGQGLDQEFPEGTIDCTTFPSDYGPIEVGWANLGGWSGIQYVTIEGNSVTHIDTAVPGGDGCKPGAMCSYACPPGYQKSQWPSAQGSTGQSIGGIQCNSNGKLVLTNPDLSKNLCIKGTGATTVQNKLSSNAAICRTDYPGTEDELVPLNTEPQSTSPLTCPDARTYFTHNGNPTSAQYYINNQGVGVQSACTWGTDGSGMGNWAPSYLGVGQDTSGKTWLSISSTAQNNPVSYVPLNFTVEIQGDTSGKCKLCDGKYCSGENYNDCNTQGCTVELMSGQATYVLAEGSTC